MLGLLRHPPSVEDVQELADAGWSLGGEEADVWPIAAPEHTIRHTLDDLHHARANVRIGELRGREPEWGGQLDVTGRRLCKRQNGTADGLRFGADAKRHVLEDVRNLHVGQSPAEFQITFRARTQLQMPVHFAAQRRGVVESVEPDTTAHVRQPDALHASGGERLQLGIVGAAWVDNGDATQALRLGLQGLQHAAVVRPMNADLHQDCVLQPSGVEHAKE